MQIASNEHHCKRYIVFLFQEIYLEGALPAQSKLLVADSLTETQPNVDARENDPAVVLASKMTLSVISSDAHDIGEL